MSSQRWRQIEELYHSACEHGVAVLDGADPDIRREVEKLLSHNSQSGGKLLDLRAADLISGAIDMPITPGFRFGPYRIDALLGEGGMGHVFRATDTRLNRPVAIKVCKEAFIDRFEQESRSIAAISHPNVCTLYDVGPNYLVMELLDGETLAARLKRGKLSLNETLRIGAHIAEALAVAHARGIVHRDLKPANIMLTKSGVKVLDFGLAKSAADPSVTLPGGVMGTPAYLAPERLEGREADVRSDIYALGLILTEMMTGRRSQSPANLPSGLDRVVNRCLELDPDDRWQSARDLKWELESTAELPTVAPLRSRSAVIAGAFGLAALLLAVFTFVSMRSKPQPQPVAQMTVILPEKSRVLSLAVSPNGHFIATVLVKDGQQQIWVRALDSLELLPLAGTIGAADPFWSPDNHSIAFFADARLKKIDRSGGPVQTLCDALGALGGTWNGNGEILIGGLSRLQRVSSAGGTASDLSDHPDVTEVDPFFLPDGEHFLTTRAANAASTGAGVWLGSMHGPDVKKILPDISKAEFMGPPPGSHIGAVVFTRAGTLMALPFDLKRLEPAGDTFPIAQGIPTNVSADLLAATSNAGVLAYVSGQQRGWQYVWRDYQGRNLGAYPDAGAVAMISPDGKQLAGDRNSDIWVSELTHGVATRLTFGPRPNMNPIWSPDGRYIAYDKIGVGIYRKPANGAGEEELLLPSKILAVPKSWSRDGKFIAYAQIDAGGADLMAIPIEGDRRPFPVVQTAANEDQGQFSPDGHWFAYTSNESGQSEIYVVPFPPAPNGGRWMVSRDGGVMPRWRRDGRELFYISPNSEMMSVEVNSQSVFQSGTPHSLFLTDMIDTGIRTGPMSWDIAPDGKRFLIISENSAGTSSLNVILNWRPEQQPR